VNIAEICLNHSLGGLELYFYWCCEYFKKTEHQLTAITVPQSRLQELLTNSQIEPELLSKAGWGGSMRAAYRLARLFEQKKIDIVHVHFAKDLPIVGLAKRLSRQKVVLVHTRQMEMPGSKKDLFHRWVYGQVDHIICVTEKLKNDVTARVPLPAEKISRLYYGVPQPSQQLSRQKVFLEQFPSPRPKVAMFSRLEKSKGQWRLLKSLSQLKKEGCEFQVYFFGHFMGGDGYEEEIKSYIEREKLQEFVYFCGFQKNPSELMGLFDVIALPSDQETFGLVLIEALAAGVAVMGSNTGGVPEIIEDGVNGFTFPPNDIDVMSKKLLILLTDETLRKKFIEVGFKKYQTLFKADDHFASLEQKMQTLVSSV
jgi:L-malate glycosyltransferase